MNIDTEVRGVVVTIDGVDYPVRDRTEETEELLREHDRRAATSTQYESDINLLEILLGKDAVKALFPNGKKESLLRLHKIARGVVDAYEYEMNEMEKDDIEKQLKQWEEIGSRTKPVIELLDKSTAAAKLKGRKGN